MESQAIKLIAEITELKAKDAKSAYAIKQAEYERNGMRGTERQTKKQEEENAKFVEKQQEAARRSQTKALDVKRKEMVISKKSKVT